MQVQSHHTHPPEDQHQNHNHTGGTHSNPRTQSYSEQAKGQPMDPFDQYIPGYGQPQQRQQYIPNTQSQMPSLYGSINPASIPPSGQPYLAMTGPTQQSNPFVPQSYLPAPQVPQMPQVQVPQERALPYSGRNDRYQFELRVEQQPQRARMCGFGDKDRRPITPPPCIRLVITDLVTGKPAPLDKVHGAYFVLQVDLWDAEGQREVNIVRSSSASPAVSISTASTTSFPPIADRPAPLDYQPPVAYTPNGQPIYPPTFSQGIGPSYYQSPHYPHNLQAAPSSTAQFGQIPTNQQSSTSMFTRNLIGSLTVNASQLKDPDGKIGFWFVLMDLSVRTEGFFRLKMNFIDISNGTAAGPAQGRVPVLAHVFSDAFQVFSAKKFPGVIESTKLSKCFAAQGIKIPIRKDCKNERDGASP